MGKVDLLGLRIAPTTAERALEEARLLSDDVPVDVELFLVVALANNGFDEGRANEATIMLLKCSRLGYIRLTRCPYALACASCPCSLILAC